MLKMTKNSLISYKEIARKNGFWLFIILYLLGVFYLNLVWKTLGDLDSLATNILFYGVFRKYKARKAKIYKK